MSDHFKKRETAIFEAFDDHIPFDPALPERNLLRAVLMSALSDVNKVGDARRQAREFFLNSDEDYIFSFRSICYFLGLDPKQILVVSGLLDSPKEPSSKRGRTLPESNDINLKL